MVLRSSGRLRTHGERRRSAGRRKPAEDVKDLDAVVAYLTSPNYGLEYTIYMVVGHSRGSLTGFKWIASRYSGDGPSSTVKMYVNVAARFRMEVSWMCIQPLTLA